MDQRLYQFHAAAEDSHWWFLAKNRIVAHLARQVLALRASDQLPPRIADIGCGGGALLALLTPLGSCEGVELDSGLRARAQARGLEVHDGRLPDRIPLPTGTFDLVCCSEVVEHVEHDQAALHTLAGLLKPGGTLIITVPAHPWLWSQHDVLNHHFRRYRKAELAAKLGATGLQRRTLSYAMCSLFPALAAARVFRRRSDSSGAGTDHAPPAPLSTVLRALFEAEKHFIPRTGLPWGSSLIAVYQRGS